MTASIHFALTSHRGPNLEGCIAAEPMALVFVVRGLVGTKERPFDVGK